MHLIKFSISDMSEEYSLGLIRERKNDRQHISTEGTNMLITGLTWSWVLEISRSIASVMAFPMDVEEDSDVGGELLRIIEYAVAARKVETCEDHACLVQTPSLQDISREGTWTPRNSTNLLTMHWNKGWRGDPVTSEQVVM